jgi:hypothetical protein
MTTKKIENSKTATKTEDLWKKVVLGLGSIDVKKYLGVDEQELKIYETPDGKLFNTEVIDK